MGGDQWRKEERKRRREETFYAQNPDVAELGSWTSKMSPVEGLRRGRGHWNGYFLVHPWHRGVRGVVFGLEWDELFAVIRISRFRCHLLFAVVI